MEYKIICFLLTIALLSCNENKPCKEFENELSAEVCKCVNLKNINQGADFQSKYEKCMEKTSELLKNGLDKYPEDSELSKEEYEENLPKLIQDIVRYNKCG